jgi:hypothetical protein
MNDQLETLKQVKRIIIDLPIQFGPKVLIAIAIIVAGIFHRPMGRQDRRWGTHKI